MRDTKVQTIAVGEQGLRISEYREAGCEGTRKCKALHLGAEWRIADDRCSECVCEIQQTGEHMPQQQKELNRLIGKVDLMMAAAEPGVVITKEMADEVADALGKVRRELEKVQARLPGPHDK